MDSNSHGSVGPRNENQIRVTQDRCDRCGCVLDNVSVVIPVNEVEQPENIRYLRHHYECENCNDSVIAHQPNCPTEGGYGTNLLAQIVLFRYEYRIPYKKLANLIQQLYSCDIHRTTVLNACERMERTARSEYEALHERIQSAEVLYADETPHLVDGSKSWIWAFTTGDETLYVFRDSRGSEVLEDVLGEEFTGIIVCDGHRSYSAYHSHLQRCWTHLLRGTDSLSDDDAEAWEIYNRLFEIFDGLKEFVNTDPSPVQRIIVQRESREELRRIAETEVESEDAEDVLTMLGNGIGHWLTFVVYPQVKPTNNTVEAILREPIAMRRIIRTLKNEKGMRLHETFLSLLRTWKQRDANPYTELKRLARKV
ncbi:IS66 family transposase [Salinibaculum rarum]|uniref:IS66 family transposase n=1 Tax=Salinibaculum rarum TaxID=3058903 RepID=UPI00265D9A70|nr:IS66 family transposase [Salinibaculum sp. KK48]